MTVLNTQIRANSIRITYQGCNVLLYQMWCRKKNQQIETERKKEWDKKEIWLLTWGIFSFVRAVKGRPPQTAVKNTAVVIQYCISHQNHAFTQRTHKGSLSSAHTTSSKNMVYWAASAERTHSRLACLSPEVNTSKCAPFQRVFLSLQHPQCHISETQSQLRLCASSRGRRPRYEELKRKLILTSSIPATFSKALRFILL